MSTPKAIRRLASACSILSDAKDGIRQDLHDAPILYIDQAIEMIEEAIDDWPVVISVKTTEETDQG